MIISFIFILIYALNVCEDNVSVWDIFCEVQMAVNCFPVSIFSLPSYSAAKNTPTTAPQKCIFWNPQAPREVPDVMGLLPPLSWIPHTGSLVYYSFVSHPGSSNSRNFIGTAGALRLLSPTILRLNDNFKGTRQGKRNGKNCDLWDSLHPRRMEEVKDGFSTTF